MIKPKKPYLPKKPIKPVKTRKVGEGQIHLYDRSIDLQGIKDEIVRDISIITSNHTLSYANCLIKSWKIEMDSYEEVVILHYDSDLKFEDMFYHSLVEDYDKKLKSYEKKAKTYKDRCKKYEEKLEEFKKQEIEKAKKIIEKYER